MGAAESGQTGSKSSIRALTENVLAQTNLRSELGLGGAAVLFSGEDAAEGT